MYVAIFGGLHVGDGLTAVAARASVPAQEEGEDLAELEVAMASPELAAVVAAGRDPGPLVVRSGIAYQDN
jgi:hypothetical protein